MSWIKIVEYKDAESGLKKIYDRVKGPDNNIDNILLIHGLRPHTLTGHMTLYKNVLHNSNNTLPKWYLEAIGVYVSNLNKCDYCFEHHFAGFKRLYENDKESEKFRQAVIDDKLEAFFDKQYFAGCEYAKQLTLSHHTTKEENIQELRNVG